MSLFSKKVECSFKMARPDVKCCKPIWNHATNQPGRLNKMSKPSKAFFQSRSGWWCVVLCFSNLGAQVNVHFYSTMRSRHPIIICFREGTRGRNRISFFSDLQPCSTAWTIIDIKSCCIRCRQNLKQQRIRAPSTKLLQIYISLLGPVTSGPLVFS